MKSARIVVHYPGDEHIVLHTSTDWANPENFRKYRW